MYDVNAGPAFSLDCGKQLFFLVSDRKHNPIILSHYYRHQLNFIFKKIQTLPHTTRNISHYKPKINKIRKILKTFYMDEILNDQRLWLLLSTASQKKMTLIYPTLRM